MSNKGVTLNEALKSVKNSLTLFSGMFGINEGELIKKPQIINSSDDKKKYIDLYYPNKIPLDTLSGYPIIDDHGYVSIWQKYECIPGNKLKLMCYVYRFESSKDSYICKNVNDDIEKDDFILNYKFHYDMDWVGNETSNKTHPPYHLQVIHGFPRYELEKQISVQDFLQKVKEVCFEDTDNLILYDEPIFLIS